MEDFIIGQTQIEQEYFSDLITKEEYQFRLTRIRQSCQDTIRGLNVSYYDDSFFASEAKEIQHIKSSGEVDSAGHKAPPALVEASPMHPDEGKWGEL